MVLSSPILDHSSDSCMLHQSGLEWWNSVKSTISSFSSEEVFSKINCYNIRPTSHFYSFFHPRLQSQMCRWFQTTKFCWSSAVLSLCPAPPLDPPSLPSDWMTALRLQKVPEFSSLMEAPLSLSSMWPVMIRGHSGAMCPTVLVMKSADRWIFSSSVSLWQQYSTPASYYQTLYKFHLFQQKLWL